MSEASNSGSVSTKQERIATLARQNPQMSFTSLAHHMDEAWLEEAYRRTRKSGAAGVDECTAEQYAVNLKENLRNLHGRLKAKRFERFGLQIHPQKSRTMPFKRPRFSESIKEARKRGRCGTFNFLGFTHCWYMSNRGNWIVRQRTARDRLSRSIQGIAQWCKKWRHLPIMEQQKILTSKLRGHYNYFGVTGNTDQLKRFCYSVRLLWKKWLSRRSNRANLNWDKFNRLLVYYPLPEPRIVHAYSH